jgi:hypothetical protein
VHNAASPQSWRYFNIKIAHQRTIAEREHRTIKISDHTHLTGTAWGSICACINDASMHQCINASMHLALARISALQPFLLHKIS